MHAWAQRSVERAQRSRAAVDRARERLSLSWAGVALVVLAGLTIAVAGLGLLGVGEDVVQHNGLATSDRSHLSLFTAHRPHLFTAH